MYEIQKDQTSPVNFFAGDYPVATAVREVSSGKSVKKYDPVKLVDGKVEPVVKVEASEANSVTAETLTTAFRNIGIFLK